MFLLDLKIKIFERIPNMKNIYYFIKCLQMSSCPIPHQLSLNSKNKFSAYVIYKIKLLLYNVLNYNLHILLSILTSQNINNNSFLRYEVTSM